SLYCPPEIRRLRRRRDDSRRVFSQLHRCSLFLRSNRWCCPGSLCGLGIAIDLASLCGQENTAFGAVITWSIIPERVFLQLSDSDAFQRYPANVRPRARPHFESIASVGEAFVRPFRAEVKFPT